MIIPSCATINPVSKYDSFTNATPEITGNFSKISEEKNLYENLDNVWDKDTIHLNENGYKIFLKKIVDKIN